VAYGDVAALGSVSLQIAPGEWVLVSGPSGCGKSTLARALCGIIPQVEPVGMQGQVVVDGLNTHEQPLAMLARHVGIVFQNPGSQLFHLRVWDEVAFGPRNLGLDEAEVRARTEWALEATGLTDLIDRRPAELSGGQKQIVAIAAVLAMRPKVLILDEPTASLDMPNVDRVINTLVELHRNRGMTIIMIEHRLASALEHATRVLLMDAGQIVFDGSPQDVFNDRARRDALGLRRPTRRKFSDGELMSARPPSRERGKNPLLALDDIWAGYNGHDVLQGVNLAFYPRDFVALVGPNGVGKSTLALVAAGLRKPRRGQVRFADGRRPRPGLDVALLFQNAADQLFTDSVDEEVAFGPRNYGCFQPVDHAQVLREADLEALVGRRPLHLSVGQQQRTALGACLALHPGLVILDEPTLGQDWGHLQRLMDFLCHLNEAGTAVLLISHDYKLVHRYATTVLHMEDGRINT
ncbi:MAG: ATP-binding cassette domain-containing protein, partial [Anaerolineae bacterium]|nr:ATP-binding cassette domain-containing protein [Anaerolineae bacterium]